MKETTSPATHPTREPTTCAVSEAVHLPSVSELLKRKAGMKAAPIATVAIAVFEEATSGESSALVSCCGLGLIMLLLLDELMI